MNKPEYFALANPSMRGLVTIHCRTTGEQVAHTPVFKAEEAQLALQMADALNDAYAAGILQGNRTRPQMQWASGQTYEAPAVEPQAALDVVADAERLRWLLDESGAEEAVRDYWTDCGIVVELDRDSIDKARGK